MNYRIKSMDFESSSAPEQVKNATAEHAQAHAQLARASQRFNDFVLRGIVPEDLRDLRKSATHSS